MPLPQIMPLPQYDIEVNIEYARAIIEADLRDLMFGPVPGGTAKLLAPLIATALIDKKISYTRVVTRQRHARSRT